MYQYSSSSSLLLISTLPPLLLAYILVPGTRAAAVYLSTLITELITVSSASGWAQK